MSARGGPNIIEDGLVLALDAANEKSFRGEPTTNLFATFSSTENNAVLVGVSPISLACGNSANWSRCDYGGGTYAFNHIETENPYGIRSLVGNLISTVTGGDYRATISNIGATTLNRTFTFSMWVKNNGGTVTSISMSIRTNGDSNGPTVGKTITNEWQRISITHTFTGTCTNEIRSYLFGLNAGLNILVYGAQLEEKPYATPFVNGTRGTTVATGGGWADISGNSNHGELVNGPTYSSANGGVIVLDGVNDYIDISLNLSTQNYTIMGSARYVSIGGRTFSGKNNNWLMGHWSSSTVKHYAEGWVTGTSGTEQSDTNWRMYAATGNYSSDSWAFYVNGQLQAGTNSAGANGPNGFSIGRYAPGNGEYSNSHISNLLVYNRVLTAGEIAQNFNATRARYNL
jgi:hypothetical protein